MIEFDPIQTSPRLRFEKMRQRVWSLISRIFFRLSPWFARGFRQSLCALAGGKLDKTASLARHSRIDYPWNLAMGELSSLGDGAWADCLDKIVIGKRCCIGEGVKLLAGSHNITSPFFDLMTKPITIQDNVWIATGVIVLPGVTIGEGAVVGAGSVVTKNVDPWTVVAGNPAKFIKMRELKKD